MANLPKSTDYPDSLTTEEVTSPALPAVPAVPAAVINAPLPDPNEAMTPAAVDAPRFDPQAKETPPFGISQEARKKFPTMMVTRQQSASAQFLDTAPAEERDFSPTFGSIPQGSPLLGTPSHEPDPATPHSETAPEPAWKLGTPCVTHVRRYIQQPSMDMNQMPIAEQSSPFASSQPSLPDAPSGFVSPQFEDSSPANPVRRYTQQPSRDINQMPIAEQSSPFVSSQPSLPDAPSGFVSPQFEDSSPANPQPVGSQANLMPQMQTYDMQTPTQQMPPITSAYNDPLPSQSSIGMLPPQYSEARPRMASLPNSELQPRPVRSIMVSQGMPSLPPPVQLPAAPMSPGPTYSPIRDNASAAWMPPSMPFIDTAPSMPAMDRAPSMPVMDRAPASQTFVAPPLFANDSQPASRAPVRPPGLIIEHAHFKFASQLTHEQLQWTLLGLFIILALVMIPFWTACVLLHSSVFTFFAGYTVPTCLLLLCIGLPVLFVATMIVFFEYAPDEHQTAYAMCIVGSIFLTLLGAALILVSMPLSYQAKAVSGDIVFNCQSAPRTMELYSTSNLLQQLRSQPSCTSAASIDSCPGYATNQYTKVLQDMERQLQCSGFCSNSSSKVGLLQVSSSPTELVSQEPAVMRLMKAGKGRLWSRLHDRVLGTSSRVKIGKQVPNQTSTAASTSASTAFKSSYPPTLFSQSNFGVSCSGMTANLFSGFVGDVAHQVYIFGLILVTLAVLLGSMGFWGPRLGAEQPFESQKADLFNNYSTLNY